MCNAKSIAIVLCVLLLGIIPSAVSAHPSSAPAPTVTSVSPTEAYNFQATAITISGADFVATPTVTLGNVPLTNVTFVDNATLTATVPADLPGGAYTLTVTNPDAQSASLASAFTVLMSGDGTLGSWQATSSMSTLREWPAVAQSGNYLYILGGYSGGGNYLSSVERAMISTSNGLLTAWQTTSSTNTVRYISAAVVYGVYLYALGGYPSNNSVEFAVINSDGSLSVWQSTSAMTMGRVGLAAVAASGYVYAIGGNYTNSVERASFNTDGSLGPWQATTAMNTRRGYLAAVVVGNYIYAIGGQNNDPGSASLSSVEWTTINADGSLGPWQTTNSMVKRRCNLAAVAAGGYVYAIGGSTCQGIIYGSVERAKVNSDGSLGTWEIISSMSTPRQRLAATQGGRYIYAIGGSDDTFALLNSVERTAISPLVFTNLSPSIVPASQPTATTISGTNFLPTAMLQLGSTPVLTTSFVSTTTLTAIVPSGLASGWHTATLTNGDGHAATLTNALRVDSTGPAAGGLTINGGALNSSSTNATLTVSASDATDNASDLSMSFSNDGTAWSAWQSYSTTASWTLTSGDGAKTVYGKFKDPAGNVSSVVSDTINLDTTVATDYGVTVNDGALFTNQVTVTLKIGAKPGTAQMQVSNEGDFAGSTWEPYTTYRSWQVTQYLSYVIPRLVYVRYKDPSGNVSSTYLDDIILDVTAPTGSVQIASGVSVRNITAPAAKPKPTAVVPQMGRGVQLNAPTDNRLFLPLALNSCSVPTGTPNVTLQLSATDDVSGVGGMLISNRADFYCAGWENYATSKAWWVPEGATTTVYVKFRDNAGNVSAPVSATTTR